MDPLKLKDNDDRSRISIDDLIKANLIQKLFAEASITVLEEAKANLEELEIYRNREKARLERLYE